MKLFNRIFLTALLAGGIAGLFLAGIQHYTIVPMILEAETYETAGGHEHPGENEDVATWAPEDGSERTFFTVVNSSIIGIGFGLLLSACFAMKQSVNWRSGILWGLAGFAVFSLAPALGLPPELPGDIAAGLMERQVWWLLTVVVTAAGLWTIVFSPVGYQKLLGAVLIAMPHVIGAPQPEIHGGLAPEELRQAFVATSLLTNAAFWVVLGMLGAALYNRLGTDSETSHVGIAAGRDHKTG